MNFTCKVLSITDDPEFGCTIQLSDTADNEWHNDQRIAEVVDVHERYFLLQRSYPEEVDEEDFYSIETSESAVELGYLDTLIIKLTKSSIKIQWSCAALEIGLRLQDDEFANLKRTLEQKFKEKVVLLRK